MEKDQNNVIWSFEGKEYISGKCMYCHRDIHEEQAVCPECAAKEHDHCSLASAAMSENFPYAAADDRTGRFFKQIEDETGLMAVNTGDAILVDVLKEHGISSRVVDEFSISDSLGVVKVIEYERDGQKRWGAEFALDGEDENPTFNSFIFTKRPKKMDVLMIELLSEINNEIFLDKFQPRFTCLQCGKELHWLDTPGGTLIEKYINVKRKYCGC